MTVYASKPEINIREKLKELDKPSGIAGEAMLRAETAEEQFNLIGAGRRNLFINGDFQVSQRGNFTSLGALSGQGYTRIDRWYTNNAGGVSLQHKLNQTLPNGNVTNTVYQVQTGTGYTSLGQGIEDWASLLGKTVTFSFWAKSNITAAFSYYDGTLQPFGVYLIPDNQWRYYTWTTTLPSSMAQFRPEIWSNGANRPAGSYFEIAQMQLELGSVATPFEHRSYGEELALCQRYYTQTNFNVQAYHGASTFASENIHWQQRMRVTPTTTLTAGTTTNVSTTYVYNTTDNGCRVEILATNAGRAFHFGGIVNAEAEL